MNDDFCQKVGWELAINDVYITLVMKGKLDSNEDRRLKPMCMTKPFDPELLTKANRYSYSRP
jgi:hypothetical protein